MKRIEKEIFWPSLAPLLKQKGYNVLAVWEKALPQHYQ
jgi:TRAP-type transport system periplasmic protein